MKKDISKVTSLKEINHFSDMTKPLYSFIKKHWTGTIAPKGYKKFTEDYEDFKGMGDEDVEQLEKDFKGYNNETAGSHSFPLKMNLTHVAYDDKCQGRNPLRTLIGSILGYGMQIGHRRAQLEAEIAFEKYKVELKFISDIQKEEGEESSRNYLTYVARSAEWSFYSEMGCREKADVLYAEMTKERENKKKIKEL